jgi:hypothetical protein
MVLAVKVASSFLMLFALSYVYSLFIYDHFRDLDQ